MSSENGHSKLSVRDRVESQKAVPEINDEHQHQDHQGIQQNNNLQLHQQSDPNMRVMLE